MACGSTADRSIGPAVESCRRAFDFTLTFEDTFFELLPSAVFLALCMVRLPCLYKSRPRVRPGRLLKIKALVASAVAVTRLAILVEICLGRNTEAVAYSSTTIPAATLLFLASASLIFLSYLEHSRSVHPSSLVFAYLALISLLGVARARTYWSFGVRSSPVVATIVALLLQSALLVVESYSKKDLIIDEENSFSREELAGAFSRSLFLWLNGLIVNGYKHTIPPELLGPVDSVFYARSTGQFSEAVAAKEHSLSHAKMRNCGHDNNLPGDSTNLRLIRLLLTWLRRPLLSPIIPRLLLTAFTFSQPFLVSTFISYLRESSPRARDNGYGLIGACVLVYGGIAITTAWYQHLTYRSVAMLRGALTQAVFDKIMKLPDDKDVLSKALTLMNSDVQRIATSLEYVHEVWAGFVETPLATWILWRHMKWSSLTVLGFAVATTVLSAVVGRYSARRQRTWFESTEKRIDSTSKMLSSLKAIKMQHAESEVEATIQALRNNEYKASRPFRRLLIGVVLLSYSTLTLSPSLVFATYFGSNPENARSLDAALLFSTLILISLQSRPLMHLLQAIPSLGAALGCLTRIQSFLSLNEHKASQGTRRRDVVVEKAASSKGSPIGPIVELNDLPAQTSGSVIVSLHEAELGYSSSNAILHGINLQILKGHHIAVVGRPGSGKSLLLRAILGEASQIQGQVSLATTKIGYCSQSPWLENISAVRTIFRTQPVDTRWQETVIQACAIDDIRALPVWDHEAVGSGGSRLSGGQRQRLALARAVALRPDLLLLDDTFSGVDSRSKRIISTQLFGPSGLLRRLGTTVVLAAGTGPPEFDLDFFCDLSEGNGLHDVTKAVQALPPSGTGYVCHRNLQVVSSEPENILDEHSERLHIAIDRQPTSERQHARLLTSDLAVYRTYFGSIGRFNLIVFFLFGVLFGFSLRFPDLWVQMWSRGTASHSTLDIRYWISIYAALGFIPLITLCGWVGHLILRVVPRSGKELHSVLLKTVLNAPFAHITTVDSGSLMNRFNQDLMFIDTTLPLDLFNASSEFFTCLMQVILVLIATTYLLSVLPVLCAVLYFIQHFYLRTSKQLRHLELESKASLHTSFTEACTGLVSIRAHGWQNGIKQELQERLDRSQEPFYMLYAVQRWLQLVLNLTVAGLTVVAGGAAVALQDKVAPAAFGVAYLNVTTLGETLTNLIVSWTGLETSLGAIARISSFQKDTPSEPGCSTKINLPLNWPTSGAISICDLHVSYATSASTPIWSLRNFSLEIRPREKIAICGRSGSGKSTLLLALLGIVPPTKGTVVIDGVDISEVNGHMLRKRVYVVSQDPFIHSKTLRQSLDPRGIHTDDSIKEALVQCGLPELVRNPQGLSCRTDEAAFSSGQMQLFRLARLFLQCDEESRGIVLLDEATSSLDVATERKMQQLVFSKLRNMTVLSVLHRLESALKYFDRVAVLDGGGLQCFGTPAEVLRQSELFDGIEGITEA